MKTKLFFMGLIPCLLLLWIAGCKHSAAKETSSEDRNENEIVLSREALDAGEIRMQSVGRSALSLPMETTGIMTFNPKRLIRITAKACGRIEKMEAFPGDRVHGGANLAELYSPEFLSAQAELLQLEDRVEQAGSQSGSDEMETSKRLLLASVRKLSMMGLMEQEIVQIQKTGEMMPLLPVRASFAGSILVNDCVLGSTVEIGTVLMTMADLSTLWVLVDVFEKNLSAVRIGSSAEIKVTAYPDETFLGRLTAIGDQVDETSRSIKARVEVFNPSLKLKPGMFANVTLVSPAAVKIVCVPERAIRDVGGKTVVFVQSGPGVFIKREVHPGRSAAGQIEILDGLKEGETIAVDGSFILKSEALKSVIEGE
jgi:cobalt-zinc-cadmium efflux system membrane fusion protein